MSLSSDAAAFRKLKRTLGIVVSVFAFALYIQSVSFHYALDDDLVLKKNSLVTKGLEGIPQLFKTDFLYGQDLSPRVPHYRPVPLILLAMEWQFFPDNPHFYHLVNILLYSISCFLLFTLLCKLFKGQNLVFPFVCSLLYAAHPIHTEVVDNIKGQDDILCFLFALLSVLAFVEWVEKKSLNRLVQGVGFYFASILSKETGISFLILTPLILFVFTKTVKGKIISIALTLAIATCVFLLIRYQVLKSISEETLRSNFYTEYMNSIRSAPSFASRVATVFYLLLRYILLLLFPLFLSYDYSFAQIPIQHLISPVAMAGIICYVFIGIYAIVKIGKRDYYAFAIFFYLLTFAPVSNVFILIDTTMAERFMYMPSLGFCMVLSFLLIRITKTKIAENKFTDLKHFISCNRMIFVFTFILTGIYSLRTVARNPDWKDNTALFTHDVNLVPNSARAHFNCGEVLLYELYPREVDKERQDSLLRTATMEFKKEIAISNGYMNGHLYLGIAYMNLGDYENAIPAYADAIRMSPSIPPAYVFCDLGLAYTKTGQYGKAISILDSSIKYHPDYNDAYIKKAFAFLSGGKNSEAIAVCDKLLKIDPKNLQAFMNAGCGYLNLKQYEKAIENFNKGLEVDSLNTDCFHFLGISYQSRGDILKAKEYFEKEKGITGTQKK